MKTTTLLVTPKMAKEFLLRNKNNRHINETTVLNYSIQMKNGEWMLSPDGLSFDENNNILNGQHRLSAVVKSDVSVMFVVTNNVPREIFSVVDTGRIRNGSDVLSMLDVKNANSIASIVKKYILLSTTNKEQNYTGGSAYGRVTNQLIIDTYKKHSELFQFLHNKSASFYTKIRIYAPSESASIMAYLIINKKHNESDVIDFFRQLHTGYEVTNATILLLRNRLIKNLYSTIKLSSKAKVLLIKKTWNNYVTGREIKVLKIDIEKENAIYFK